MRKSLYASVILFVLGIGACSDDDDVQGGGDDEYGYDDGAVLADDAIPQTIPHQSYFIANEDWFGHEMGSCNGFTRRRIRSSIVVSGRLTRGRH